MRPSERVLHYLRSEFLRPELQSGARLPTIRDLSRHLDVSPATVRNVFQKLAREGRIRSEVGNGTFLVAPPGKTKASLTIGVNVALFREYPPVGNVYKAIYGGIMHGILGNVRPIALQALPPEIWGHEDEYREKPPDVLRNLDGIILFPLAFSNRLRRHYEAHCRPAVNLNPPTASSTADYVSPDFFDASYRLARVWKRAGRRRLALLTYPDASKSVSVRLRCAGFLAGIEGELGRKVEVRSCSAAELSPDGGEQVLRRMAEKERFVPDAVYAVNDSLAAGAIAALSRCGKSVPGDASVVGGNAGAVETVDGTSLTRMRQPLESIGQRLIEILLEKIENGNRSVPGCVLPMVFVGGGTTTPEENLGLELAQ